jgi:hypothetical protein
MHDPRILERWRTIFATWQTSGLSVTAFCRSRDLNLSSFYRWRNILDALDRSSATRPRPPAKPQPSPSFVPVRVVPDAVVEVILASGLRLRVPLAAEAGPVARLVHALEAAPC